MPPPQRSISNDLQQDHHHHHHISISPTNRHHNVISDNAQKRRPVSTIRILSSSTHSNTTITSQTSRNIRKKRRRPRLDKEWEEAEEKARCWCAGAGAASRTRFLVLFVFFSCFVSLSTPSSTPATRSPPTAASSTSSATYTNETIIIQSKLLSSSSSSSQSPLLSSSSPAPVPAKRRICPTAQKWITTKGSFCFTLRESSFLKNETELDVREERAIAMFCELDRILEKVDCAQPYSVNVNRKQCWLCREAYRDWACAMTTDTLQDGRMDCDREVMPCPSCASICHQVMRLCPYLTPDRIQFDENGDPTPHVSQYGGHPAFYCPLENFHAFDPAYTNDCAESSSLYSTLYNEDPDYVHNLCAANARYHVSQKKSPSSSNKTRRNSLLLHSGDDDEFHVPHYSTCCWTYSYSLVQEAGLLEKSIKEHDSGYSNSNRVILECCDESGRCDSSDPDNVTVSTTTPLPPSPPPPTSSSSSSPTPPPSREQRSSSSSSNLNLIRTANNQVLGKDGKFRELNHNNNNKRRTSYSELYLADNPDEEDEEEDDDEEYYEDSSSAGEMFDSSSNTISKRFVYDEQHTPPTSSIHRDNNNINVHSERKRSDESFIFYYQVSRATSVAASGAGSIAPPYSLLLYSLVPPLAALLLIYSSSTTHLLCLVTWVCFELSVHVVWPALCFLVLWDSVVAVLCSRVRLADYSCRSRSRRSGVCRTVTSSSVIRWLCDCVKIRAGGGDHVNMTNRQCDHDRVMMIGHCTSSSSWRRTHVRSNVLIEHDTSVTRKLPIITYHLLLGDRIYDSYNVLCYIMLVNESADDKPSAAVVINV